MSLKSFDKFCENIIMGEPVDRKDVFDERQNQLRSRLASQALFMYAIMSYVWVLFYDLDVRIFESAAYGLVVLMAASYLIYVIRGLKNGCILGVKYTSAKTSAIILCVESVVLPIVIFLSRSEKVTGFKSFFVKGDYLTDMLALLISAVMILTASILVLVAAIMKDREAAASDEE